MTDQQMKTDSVVDRHRAKLEAVAAQVAARPARSPITIHKATPSHSIRDSAYKQASHPIDVRALDQIIEIDPRRQIAIVEGQVTMGQLARETLAFGLVPAVVPEFSAFTMAGLINGEGIQSSSHRYGTFTRTIGLPQGVSEDGISADYKNGVLEIHAAKPEQTKPRRIQVGSVQQATIEGEATEK